MEPDARNVLVDTGPLVASINRRDQFHHWAKKVLAEVQLPLLTCESVVSEACFLLRRWHGGQDGVMALLRDGLLHIPFRMEDEADAVSALLKRYQSVPMALADACLVRMSEQIPESRILTLDSDFLIYRKNQDQVVPVIMPQR
ncbi:MAG: PIN domain-containing protein [Leptolyngbyaceae bacterium]|nr:PIN domain-containing protein [Leptolyngbyaceae bacterium]